MSNNLSPYALGIKGEQDVKKAELLQKIICEKQGITLETEAFDENKKQIVFSENFALTLAPAQYGWRIKENKIELANGAFIDFETVAREFAEQTELSDKIITAPERYFELKDHTLAALNAKSDEMIKKILAADNTDISGIKGNIYYVSEKRGNDANSGLSADDAWRTLEAVSKAELKHGDAVLFERGGLYRTGLGTVSGVTYGSYGEGDKPILCGSSRNYANGNLWELYDAENHIWKLTVPVLDPGIIVYNAHTRDIDCYGEITGRRILDKEEISGFEALKSAEDLCFYWGTPETVLETFDHRSKDYPVFIKSVKDPNTDFCDIEIGEDIPIFYIGSNSDITVDNLCFKFCGGHAIRGYLKVENLTVTNCVFAWIGGSLLWKSTRYGNAIEIFGGCDGYVTKNNWIYEIYDTGITFQYHFKDGEPHMNNITISDNVIERSYWLLEWWLSPDVKGAPCSSKNILIENNFLKFGFKSWGTVQHGLHTDDLGRTCSWGAGIAAGGLGDTAENIVIKNNIMDRSYVDGYDHVMTRHLNYYSGGSAACTEWIDNTFIQLDNQFFGRISTDEGAVFYPADKENVDIALSKIPVMSGTKICLIKTGS